MDHPQPTKEQAAAGAADWADYIKANGNKPATLAMVYGAVEKAFDMFVDVATRQLERIETLERERAELQSRCAVLEGRPELKYAGPYRIGESYAAGCLASKGGGLWLAERSTSANPGSADSGWRLIVKSGGA